MEPLTRFGVVILSMITAVMHFWLITIMGSLNAINLPFLLNGVGYLALASLFVFTIPGLGALSRWKHLALAIYTVVTIVAWIAVGDRTEFAFVNKAVEMALLVMLAAHWRQTRASDSTAS